MKESSSPESWEDSKPVASPLETTTGQTTNKNDSEDVALPIKEHGDSIERSSSENNESGKRESLPPNPVESSNAVISESAKLSEPPTVAVFLNSVVSDPQKEQDGSQNAYISYFISTESNNPMFQTPVFSVRRRYSDFSFLYQTLFTEYPAAVVPPLVDKARLEFIKGDRFGPEFTNKRATSLNRFLNRISQHPILKKSVVYLNFLETPDWNSFKRSLTIRHQQIAQNKTLPDTLPDSVLDSSIVLPKFDGEHNERVKEKVGKLDDNVAQVEKAFTKVLRRQHELGCDLEDFSQQLLKLAGLEHNLEYDIITFAGGTHNLSQGVAKLREQTDEDYLVSLRDMQNYIVALKAVIKLGEQKQSDLGALSDSHKKVLSEKESVVTRSDSNFLRNKIEDVRGVDHEAARKERLGKLDLKIERLKSEFGTLKQSSETFQQLAINEIDIFEDIKRLELKTALTTLAVNHITFYQNVVAQFENLL